MQTATANTCTPGFLLNPPPSQDLQVLSSDQLAAQNVHRAELQMFLPVINAPFRIYWAYNPLRLDSPASRRFRSRAACSRRGQVPGGGDYTYNLARNAYSPSFLLREPRKTFRFTVATTF